MATRLKPYQSVERPEKRSATLTSKARVQRYRERLREHHCRRVELWLANGVLDDLRRLSTYQQQPLRAVILDALRGYVARYSGVLRVLSAAQMERDR